MWPIRQEPTELWSVLSFWGVSSQSWSMELRDSHGFVQSCVEVNTALAISAIP